MTKFAHRSPALTGHRNTLRLLRFSLSYWRGWLGLLLLTLCASALSLLQPWPMRVLVDGVLGRRQVPPWMNRAAGLAGLPTVGLRGFAALIAAAGLLLFVMNALLDAGQALAWVRLGQGIVYDLARKTFARIQRRSLLFHSRMPVGDSMNRITTDTWCTITLVESLVLGPLQAALYIIGAGAVMVRLNWHMATAALVTAPAMAIGVRWVGRKLRPVARAKREADSRVSAHVQQTLSGIQVVQAFGREQEEHARFRTLAGHAVKAQRHATVLGSFSGLWIGMILTCGNAVVLLIGGSRVLAGDMTVGGLLVFLAYLNVLQSKIRTLADTYTRMQSLAGQIDRVVEVLDTVPEVSDQPGATTLGSVRGEVIFKNVTFSYATDQPVLHNVSLEVQPGHTIAIVGPTGAGKSTLVSLIPRFFDPATGSVTLDGQDLREIRLKDLRECVALVPQEPFLFPLSIAQNIAFGKPDATRSRIETAARDANAHDFIVQLPQGYDTVIGERGATLSGGERQRISIARALLKDAPVLVLDEPTSALDARTESLLVEALARLMKGRTTFIIAHRLSTIRNADRIVVLDSGRIVEQGSRDELLRRRGAFAQLYELQFGRAAAAPLAVESAS
jgi:ATP-binding cassette subfamily B protein